MKGSPGLFFFSLLQYFFTVMIHWWHWEFVLHCSGMLHVSCHLPKKELGNRLVTSLPPFAMALDERYLASWIMELARAMVSGGEKEPVASK